MADCRYIPECDFYHDRLDGMPATAEFMKTLFCHKQVESCARYLYQYHKETDEVPRDLMPYEKDKAQQLMDGAS
ncbi:MAG: hypothetical protein KAR83_02355 [Thermodesulfovibrionales bacterium]|nr:hypothetical protein [Thermodesulfovibrionales bacterium]